MMLNRIRIAIMLTMILLLMTTLKMIMTTRKICLSRDNVIMTSILMARRIIFVIVVV